MKKQYINAIVFLTIILACNMLLLSSCMQKNKQQDTTRKEGKTMNIKKELLGKIEDGREVFLYTLSNTNGMRVQITSYGGIVTSLMVQDKNGAFDDVVLGYDQLNDYIKFNNPYFGAIIGRFGNRIAKGEFELDGKVYQLATNNGENHLHGGVKGFDKVLWEGSTELLENEIRLSLKYLSADKEEGYPGNLHVEVIYSLTNDNELKIHYIATSDKPTPINLTHHSYFNLAGAGQCDILGHELMINADRYTVVDESLIPTGELRAVKGTPMDFRSPQNIGNRINEVPGGYDHNYVLNKKMNSLELVASVFEPTTDRVMEVYTTEPGIQFYSGNFLDGSNIGKGNLPYEIHHGFCLETQHFPDSPNQPGFPSVILQPGEKYEQTTIYKFSIGKDVH